MFKHPLSEKEVIRATKSAEKVFKDQNKDYKYKNETLINLLEITDEEQKEMQTIISKEEYRRRDREYQKKKYDSKKAKMKYDSKKAKIEYKNKLKEQGKLSKKEEIELQKKKIKSLREQGLKNKEISQKLDITQKTLERYITNMRKSGLI